MTKPFSWKSGSEILPGYVIERVLGRGGMGAVMLVEYVPTGKKYAVKTAIFSDGKTRRRFMEEVARWHALPPTPHWVQCFFSREIENRVHVFAEYVEGGSLDSWIREELLPTVSDKLDIAIQLATSLHELHAHGLVHQDVKPQNVLISAQGKVKLADFGLAGARPQTLDVNQDPNALVTLNGMTLAYRSPEQANRKRVDVRTDQWSWALTVVAMFAGGTTWRFGEAGPEALQDCLSNLHGQFRRLLMPLRVAGILQRALQIDPAKRWPSMAFVVGELKEVYQSLMNSRHASGSLARIMHEYEERGIGMHEASITFPGGSRKESSAYLQSRGTMESFGPRYVDPDPDTELPGQAFAARAMTQLRRLDMMQNRLESKRPKAQDEATTFDTLLAVYEQKAAAYRRLGDLRKAIEYFGRAVEHLSHRRTRFSAEELRKMVEYHRLSGHLSVELGEYDIALESLNRSSQNMELLVADVGLLDVASTEHMWLDVLAMRVATSKGFLLHKSGQSSCAHELLHAAVSARIDSWLPMMPELRQDIARVRLHQGMVLTENSSFEQAEELLRDAQNLIGELPGQTSVEGLNLLADILMWLGVAEHKREKVADAAGLFLRSKDIREKQVLPDEPILARIGLAECYTHEGLLLEQAGEILRAFDCFALATKNWDIVVHELGLVQYKDRLANTMLRESNARKRLGLPSNDENNVASRLIEHLVNREGRVELPTASTSNVGSVEAEALAPSPVVEMTDDREQETQQSLNSKFMVHEVKPNECDPRSPTIPIDKEDGKCLTNDRLSTDNVS